MTQLIHKGFVDIGEGDGNVGIRQKFANKATANVASTKMNCILFHLYLPQC
ncbi:Uncharacterised protein [Vibrio cholerae]|nr:Uncharacterised protein [Vibrio cholerae]